MNFDELMRRVLDIMPDAIFSEDSENEIIISTGLMSVSLAKAATKRDTKRSRKKTYRKMSSGRRNEELIPVNKENI